MNSGSSFVNYKGIVPASIDVPNDIHEVNGAQLNNAIIYGHKTSCTDTASIQLHLDPAHNNFRGTPLAIFIENGVSQKSKFLQHRIA